MRLAEPIKTVGTHSISIHVYGDSMGAITVVVEVLARRQCGATSRSSTGLTTRRAMSLLGVYQDLSKLPRANLISSAPLPICRSPIPRAVTPASLTGPKAIQLPRTESYPRPLGITSPCAIDV